MRKNKTILTTLLALVMLVALAVPSLAFSQEEHAARQPDYSRTGSVTVNVLDGAGKAVSGGSLTAYEVAAAQKDDGNNIFVLTDAFAASEADLAALETEENGAPNLAASLAGYAASKGLKGTTAAVSDAGTAVFSNLELGVYLVVQDSAAKGYEPLRPFLITVPMWDGEQLVYDVVANPKPGTATEQAKLDPPVQKLVNVKNGKAPESSVFTFRMKPAEAGAPMPENAAAEADGSVIVKRTGAGAVEFGTMWFTLDNVGKTYSYQITEVKGSEQNYTYDGQTYTMTVAVSEKDGRVVIDVKYTDKDGNAVDTMKFTNIYDAPKQPPLPQTGQLWWPVIVMAAVGMLMVVLGVSLRRKQS